MEKNFSSTFVQTCFGMSCFTVMKLHYIVVAQFYQPRLLLPECLETDIHFFCSIQHGNAKRRTCTLTVL